MPRISKKTNTMASWEWPKSRQKAKNVHLRIDIFIYCHALFITRYLHVGHFACDTLGMKKGNVVRSVMKTRYVLPIWTTKPKSSAKVSTWDISWSDENDMVRVQVSSICTQNSQKSHEPWRREIEKDLLNSFDKSRCRDGSEMKSGSFIRTSINIYIADSFLTTASEFDDRLRELGRPLV